MDQNALTIVVPIKLDQLTALNDLLTHIGTHIRQNDYLDVSKLSTTHFFAVGHFALGR